MRKMIQLFFWVVGGCLLLLAELSAQNYLPIVKENAEWTVLKRTTNTQDPKPPYPTVFSYVTTWIKGDTSIAGVSFKKVFHREFSPGANVPIYQGAIREAEQVVSWIPSGQGLNRLDTLYDFNVEAGDTVAYYRDMSPYYLYVGKIDSITLNDNIKRKRISIYVDFVGTPEIEQNPVNSWVEGFGEMRFGLIYPFCFSSNPRCGDEFRCYKEDNSIIYESSLFACYESNTQTFLPFPTKNAEWSRVVTVVGDYDPVYITSHYAPEGDTTIKNKIFTKLYIDTGKAFRIDSAQYVGAYINESNRVFFIDKGELIPRLLYDFNLPVGWIGESSPNCNPNALRCVLFRLASIDTVVYTDQVKRARFNFEIGRKPSNGVFMGRYAYSWIEGIGSTLGFFPDISNTMFVPVTPQVFLDLLCFKQNDNLLYTHPRLYKGNCFVDVVDDVETIDDPSAINIYPNPASEILFIQHDLNVSKSTASAILIDVMGRVVLKRPLDALLVEVDISTISPGIYFVQILSKEGRVRVCKKIIKVH